MVFMFGTVGCGGLDTKPSASAELDAGRRQQARQDEVERQRETRAALKRQRLERVLDLADKALARGRLTLPAEDNAYDRYKAVQLIDPGNDRADQGLKRVLLAYVNLADEAIRSGKLQQASAFVKQAQAYYGEHLLLTELRRQIAKTRIAQLSARSHKSLNPSEQSGDRVDLPVQALSSRNDEIKSLLSNASQRLMQSDESVMIHARNDAEGRWIYKVMMEASPGYRIRGDIRIRRSPALVFQSPM